MCVYVRDTMIWVKQIGGGSIHLLTVSGAWLWQPWPLVYPFTEATTLWFTLLCIYLIWQSSCDELGLYQLWEEDERLRCALHALESLLTLSMNWCWDEMWWTGLEDDKNVRWATFPHQNRSGLFLEPLTEFNLMNEMDFCPQAAQPWL